MRIRQNPLSCNCWRTFPRMNPRVISRSRVPSEWNDRFATSVGGTCRPQEPSGKCLLLKVPIPCKYETGVASSSYRPPPSVPSPSPSRSGLFVEMNRIERSTAVGNSHTLHRVGQQSHEHVFARLHPIVRYRIFALSLMNIA